VSARGHGAEAAGPPRMEGPGHAAAPHLRYAAGHMREQADVVIVGAGIMGLAIAYNLAKTHGITSITVVDRSYLCGGASGRNGGKPDDRRDRPRRVP
jgi:NADPH-dependent 2,4-dienoyl-CoA reductase/sulfur reductase-like enzyme